MDDGFGATADDDIGAAGLDHAGGVGDSLCAGGAGTDESVNTSACADFETHDGSGAVGHDLGDHVGGDSRRTLLEQGVVCRHE